MNSFEEERNLYRDKVGRQKEAITNLLDFKKRHAYA